MKRLDLPRSFFSVENLPTIVGLYLFFVGTLVAVIAFAIGHWLF